MSRSVSRWILAVLVALGLAPGVLSGQSPPPHGDWVTFETEHFRVTYEPELEPLAREAAAVAERTHAVLRRELAEAPEGMIDLVVGDHADFSGGYAMPFPSNRVVVLVRPGTTRGEFYARDWIELVVTHELVHTFHMDRSGGAGRLVRSVLGRLPLLWPVFAVPSTPAWSTEGLATHYESRLTGTGRVEASFHDMIIRTAALEDRIPALDELSAPSPVWPAGNRSYVYGARLMRYVAERYGAEAHATIVDATAGSWWPTFLRFDHVAEEAVGRPFDALYDAWRAAARDTAEAVARRVRANGETATRAVAGRGPYAVAPRVSPDGTRLTFAASDWRSDPATRLVDLGTGAVRTVARQNQPGSMLGPADWLPDGSGLIVAQMERHGPYRLYTDLWRLSPAGDETRLTDGLRLSQPDVAPDGRRVAAVQSHRGGLRLVVHDLEDGGTRVVAEAAPGQAFDGPRWSPDGRRIAVARHVDGRMDLVVVDAATGATTRVTDDQALDMAPAWSPDGRWLLWWSDRTGIPNIVAAAMQGGRPAGPVMQVTNVITGVIDPEVDPAGETLYVAAYHHDGWQIEALPFDPASWRPAPAPRQRYGDALLPAPSRAPDIGGEASRYSPLPTLGPYYWMPTWESTGGAASERLRFLGAAVEGRDVLERHRWGLAAAGDIDTGRLQGNGFWVYRGLGSPELYVAASRSWDRAGAVDLGGGEIAPLVRVEDEVAVGARLFRSRWRSQATLRVAAELERQAYEGRDMTRPELEDRGVVFPDLPALAGLTVEPSYSNVRYHPFSISPEDGVSVSLGGGHWWATDVWDRGYDELAARVAGYLAAPVWGFADHVLTLQATGLVRDGDHAPLRAIGGAAIAGVIATGTTFGSDNPVRGFDRGSRRGNRVWTASAEWRFPIHLRNASAARELLGFSLTALSGAVFADAGDAWCTPELLSEITGCSDPGVTPLVGAGAELRVDFGALHDEAARLVLGLAQPIRGPAEEPVFYLAIGY